ncbi:hypothetical protein TWF281_006999 [Arthrobotrys megalospora]
MASEQTGSRTLFEESFVECEIFCRFLIHISRSFNLSLTSNDVRALHAVELTKQYLQWANPPTPRHKEKAWIPEAPAPDLEETHAYILQWSQRFLDSRLQDQVNPLTGEPVPGESIIPPTKSEITRVARAFYQLFLCLVYCGFDLVDPKHEYQYDDDGISDECKLGNTLIYVIAETLNYLDLTIIYELLLDFMGDLTRPVISRIKSRTFSDVPPFRRISHAFNAEWYIMAALGPQGLWKFLFEFSLEEQKAICATSVGNGFVNPRSFIRRCSNMNTGGRTYPPFIRICRNELVIGVGDQGWWNFRSSLTDRRMVVWDDWRLKEWDYHLPMIKLPLYLPGQPPFRRFDCDLSTPTVPYEEHSMETYYREMLFPEMSKLEWGASEVEASASQKSILDLVRVSASCKPFLDLVGISTPDKPLLVGDVLGREIPVTPSSSQPVRTLLPLEVQGVILELAEYSQYATLRAVCRYWKAETWRILKSRYEEPFRPDKASLDGDPIAASRRFTPASQSDSPFLIHSALVDFTGYVRGRIDYSHYPSTLDIGKIYSEPDPDDPLVLLNTEHLRAAADYPIIIPNTENPQPLTYSICYGFGSLSQFDMHGGTRCLGAQDEALKLSKITTVKTFLGVFFQTSQNKPRLRSLPPDGQAVKRFSAQVVKTARLGFRISPIPGYVEINLKDPYLIYDDEGV